MLIALVVCVVNKFDFIQLIKDIIKISYGGRILLGYYGVFWFITCLFITQILFILINLYFKLNIQLLVVFSFYLLAHIISSSQYISSIKTPWNFDVSFLALTYYAGGFYSRKWLASIKDKLTYLITGISTCILFVVIENNGLFSYNLNMKDKIFNHVVLDILIPFIFTFTLCLISYWISLSIFKNLFLFFGNISLVIMYLHMPINIGIRQIGINTSFLEFIIIGLLVPILFSFVIKNFSITKRLFLGEFKNVITNETKKVKQVM
jgi:polysaccharide biosynthesis protein PslL